MKNQIITIKNKAELTRISDNVETIEEAQYIIKLLRKNLKQISHGIGLSAIQIGIPKRVGLIIYKDIEYQLINPIIKECIDEFIYYNEGCLSIPGKFFNVIRYHQIHITNMKPSHNGWEEEECVFAPSINNTSPDMIGIAIQHEIDHFNGILICDKVYKSTPIINTKSPNRNSLCPCGSNKKYKKCCMLKRRTENEI